VYCFERLAESFRTQVMRVALVNNGEQITMLKVRAKKAIEVSVGCMVNESALMNSKLL